MRRKTLLGLLGSAVLAVTAVVAGPAIAAAGDKAQTTGAGTTVQGKFEVSAKTTQEGVLGGASGHVGFNDLRLNVVCMANDNVKFSFIEAQDPATGFYWDVFMTDNGPASASPTDQFFINGPFFGPICGEFGGFFGNPLLSGNLVVKDAAP